MPVISSELIDLQMSLRNTGGTVIQGANSPSPLLVDRNQFPITTFQQYKHFPQGIRCDRRNKTAASSKGTLLFESCNSARQRKSSSFEDNKHQQSA